MEKSISSSSLVAPNISKNTTNNKETLAQNSVVILEVCRVAPAPGSLELTLPLTLYDTFWFKFNPVERIFFYRIADPTRTHFESIIVPNLKRSLSLALTHFLPLAGRLKWPAHDPIPSVLYKPNDSVSLTVAEAKNPESFTHLAGDKPCKASESRLCVPELPVTDSEAAVISFQVTLFPNHGLAIGITAHHAILDGKSTTLFLKAWAYMNKLQLYPETSPEEATQLPAELAPFLDRSVVHDPDGVCQEFLEFWSQVRFPGSENSNPSRSLSLFPAHDLDPALVRATFVVSAEDVRKLRDLVVSKTGSIPLHLSTFVLVLSYTLTCLVKAKKNMESSSYKILYVSAADCRARVDPPMPENYFGNCVTSIYSVLESEAVKGEDGIAVVARSVSESIQELGKSPIYERCKKSIELLRVREPLAVGVAGSPRFEVYKTDFGWGSPLLVELTSIDRTGSVSMAERRDGSSGGVEIGLVLTKEEMDVFETVFHGGLLNLSA